MIAIDTNILVHAHRRGLPKHDRAVAWLTFLAEGGVPWGLPVFCLGEFCRVVTHPRVFDPPSTLKQALAALDGVMESPMVRLLIPGPGYASVFREVISEADARGNLVFDAQIVTVCRENGVSHLLTEDRDFNRFRVVTRLSLEADFQNG